MVFVFKFYLKEYWVEEGLKVQLGNFFLLWRDKLLPKFTTEHGLLKNRCVFILSCTGARSCNVTL